MPAIYYTDIDEFMDLPGLFLLPPSRRERTQRFLLAEDKARCVAAGLLIRRWVSANEPRTGPHGKLYVPHGPCFNLSHSGQLVVLAVAHCDVGVDVETIRPWSERVAKKCFTPSEQQWLHAADDPLSAFYILWTAKESVMKASGAGFTMPPESFTIDPDASHAIDARGARFMLHWWFLERHVVCSALPLQAAEATWQLRKCSREELIA